MRTTVTLDDSLLRAAKQRANERGTTLSVVVADALRADLARREAMASAERFETITYGHGAALPGVDINDNRALRDLLDEDGWTSSM